jgi:hypothetical protein
MEFPIPKERHHLEYVFWFQCSQQIGRQLHYTAQYRLPLKSMALILTMPHSFIYTAPPGKKACG